MHIIDTTGFSLSSSTNISVSLLIIPCLSASATDADKGSIRILRRIRSTNGFNEEKSNIKVDFEDGALLLTDIRLTPNFSVLVKSDRDDVRFELLPSTTRKDEFSQLLKFETIDGISFIPTCMYRIK
ncbi:MAG TPA: hypothetical protein V6C76_03240 [Drouetiella sp.]